MKRVLAALLFGAVAASPGASPAEVAPEEAAQEAIAVVHTLAEFHRPESCAVAAGGEMIYVTNCASERFGDRVGLVAGKGTISRVSVDHSGQLRMANAKFIEGLNGPLGITTISGIGTVVYGPGTIFVNVGSALSTDASGNPIRDGRKLETGVLTIDHQKAIVKNLLDLGVGSTMEKILGHPMLLPNGLTFDGDANLYVSDSALGGELLEPKAQGKPGVLRVDREALESLNEDHVTFLPVPGVPNGVTYCPKDDSIYIVTMGAKGQPGGAVHRIPVKEFKKAKLPAPVVSDLGALDGVVVTPAGTIIVSRIAGDLVAIRPGKKPQPLKLNPDTPLLFPSDIKLLAREDGTSLLFVPEQEPGGAKAWGQRVRVLRLPRGF